MGQHAEHQTSSFQRSRLTTWLNQLHASSCFKPLCSATPRRPGLKPRKTSSRAQRPILWWCISCRRRLPRVRVAASKTFGKNCISTCSRDMSDMSPFLEAYLDPFCWLGQTPTCQDRQISSFSIKADVCLHPLARFRPVSRGAEPGARCGR